VILDVPQLFHIGFHHYPEHPVPDPKLIEGVVTAYASDWVRYASNCYLVWTVIDLETWQHALLRIPNMNSSTFLILTVDTSADFIGNLPQWIWDWILRYKNPNTVFTRLG
jgi:hypothetical protein